MKKLGNIAIIGASGAIGAAFVRSCRSQFPDARVHSFSQSLAEGSTAIDYNSEESMARAAQSASADMPLDLVVCAGGILHYGDTMPEKSLRDLSAEKFERVFAINTIIPALLAKHFLPQLSRDTPSVFAALSARVGSISDNRLGGWYAYRASKAALNMIIKNAALEMSRRNPKVIVVGLHPGTVDSPLSQPFQKNVAPGKLFTADYAAQQMLGVLQGLTPQDSGRCFAWDGAPIAP